MHAQSNKNRTPPQLLRMSVIGIIPNLSIDGNLDPVINIENLLIIISSRLEDRRLSLRLDDARLAVDPVALGFGAHVVEGVGVRSVGGGDVGRDATGAGGKNVRRAGGPGIRGPGDGEGAAVLEAPADGEYDTQGHGGCEDCGHAGDDGLDGVFGASGLHDEPEQHVDHVD